MLQGDDPWESARESLQHLRCHGDLGHHDDSTLARRDAFPHGTQINLRLPATGHSVEQKRLGTTVLGSPRADCLFNFSDATRLIGCEIVLDIFLCCVTS